MSTHEFEFEAFQDNFTLAVDEPTAWPEIRVELTVKWHPAEPDVGIFSKQAELTDQVIYVDGVAFGTEDEAAAAFYALHADEIEETQEAVSKVIRDQINEWESELEDE